MSADQIAVKIEWQVMNGVASVILKTQDDYGQPIRIGLDLEQAQHTADLLNRAVTLAEESARAG
jgi:hypothetical protein